MKEALFEMGRQRIRLQQPDATIVKENYLRQKAENPDLDFPHWTKLWPASRAMAAFIDANSYYVQDKTVLELAAGLGLPSLVASAYAREVCSSDYLTEAVDTIALSVQKNGFTNVRCVVLNWWHLPDDLKTDVLILSDINYSPPEFEQLFAVIRRFLNAGATILLSTPQRLMARSFIEKLIPWCIRQEEARITEANEDTYVSILVLKSTDTN